jgi:hypothetical protein
MLSPSELTFLQAPLTQRLSASQTMIDTTRNKNIFPGESRCSR